MWNRLAKLSFKWRLAIKLSVFGLATAAILYPRPDLLWKQAGNLRDLDALIDAPLTSLPEINAAIDAGRKAAIASKDKGIISNASQPKFHIWLPEELTPHGDEATLTSTLKLKRNVVNKMYADTIEQGYKDQTAKFAKKK